jgi:hypothetical protein
VPGRRDSDARERPKLPKHGTSFEHSSSRFPLRAIQPRCWLSVAGRIARFVDQREHPHKKIICYHERVATVLGGYKCYLRYCNYNKVAKYYSIERPVPTWYIHSQRDAPLNLRVQTVLVRGRSRLETSCHWKALIFARCVIYSPFKTPFQLYFAWEALRDVMHWNTSLRRFQKRFQLSKSDMGY